MINTSQLLDTNNRPHNLIIDYNKNKGGITVTKITLNNKEIELTDRFNGFKNLDEIKKEVGKFDLLNNNIKEFIFGDGNYTIGKETKRYSEESIQKLIPKLKSIHSIPESIVEKFQKGQKTTDMMIISKRKIIGGKSEIVFHFGKRKYPPLGIGFAGGMIEEGESSTQNMEKELEEEMNIKPIKLPIESKLFQKSEVRGKANTTLTLLYVEDPNTLNPGDDLIGKRSFTLSELKKIVKIQSKGINNLSFKEKEIFKQIGYFVPHHLEMIKEFILQPDILKNIKSSIKDMNTKDVVYCISLKGLKDNKFQMEKKLSNKGHKIDRNSITINSNCLVIENLDELKRIKKFEINRMKEGSFIILKEDLNKFLSGEKVKNLFNTQDELQKGQTTYGIHENIEMN